MIIAKRRFFSLHISAVRRLRHVHPADHVSFIDRLWESCDKRLYADASYKVLLI